jgi:hypothetical protein
MRWYKYHWGFPENKIKRGDEGGTGWGVVGLTSNKNDFFYIVQDYSGIVSQGQNPNGVEDEFKEAENVESITIKQLPKRHLQAFVKMIFETYIG